jgi:Phospholipase_D-nuclease N-terminal
MFIIESLIGLVAFIFWVWMLIDCLSSSRPTGEKLLWFLVIFFLNLLGALIYYFLGRSPRAA